MIVDCGTCEVRGAACSDCVVTVLLGAPPNGVVLDEDERQALEVLADSGLVPPLRLVPAAAGQPFAARSAPRRRTAAVEPTRGERAEDDVGRAAG